MEYHSIRQLEELCKTEQKPVWKIVLKAEQTETDETEKQIFERMRQMYHEMKAADEGYAAELRSASGMAGGDGEKMHRFNVTGKNLCSGYMALAMEKALKMGESNACMKRIVAAPTAGACGVLPAVLITYEQIYKIPEAKMLEGMYIAAGVGQVIAERACIAGAQGGCQAEIGSASCMAAAAITYIRGGSTKQVFDAGAFALKSLLGLVCDPLGGLVEVPCIKRNVIGSVNAITASDMAMAEIESKVPLDEVIDAMAEVGDLLPCSLKETSQAGLAQTETGKKYMPES